MQKNKQTGEMRQANKRSERRKQKLETARHHQVAEETYSLPRRGREVLHSFNVVDLVSCTKKGGKDVLRLYKCRQVLCGNDVGVRESVSINCFRDSQEAIVSIIEGWCMQVKEQIKESEKFVMLEMPSYPSGICYVNEETY